MLPDSPLIRCPILVDTFLTVFVFVLGTALGRLLLRKLGLHLPSRLEFGLFAVTLGVGLLSYLPFVLFAVGIGWPAAVVSVTLFLALLLWRDMAAVVRGLWAARSKGFCQILEQSWWGRVLVFGIGVQIVGIGVRALCPITDPDGLHYHLMAPQQYLQAGRFIYLPTFLHVNWPLGVEMLFALGLAFSPYYAVGTIHYGLGLLLLLAVYALGRRAVSTEAGLLAAGLLLPLMRSIMPAAYIDLGLALYALMALYALFLGWQAHPTNSPFREAWPLEPMRSGNFERWCLLSALLAGFAATAKLSGILHVVTLGVVVFFLSPGGRAGPRWRTGGLLVGRYLLIGFLVALPWYLRCWALTGNPFYPYLWAVFPTRDWDAAAQRRLTEYFQVLNSFRGKPALAPYVLPARLVLCTILAVVGVGAAYWQRLAPIRPIVGFFLLGAFLQVGTSGIYSRFFLPLLPSLLLTLLWFLRGLLARSAVVSWVSVVLVLALLYRAPGELRGMVRAVPAALGLETRESYLNQRIPMFPVCQWINANLPSDAVIVLGTVYDPYAALIDRRTLTTSLWTQNALRFDSWEIFLADLKRLRATHLIFQTGLRVEAERLERESAERVRIEQPLLARLGRELGEPLFAQNGYTLYQLRIPLP